MPESRIKNTEDTKRGLYPSVFKKINQTDVKLNPFQTFKPFTILSGSSTGSALPLTALYTDMSKLPALETELTFNDAANIDGSLQSVTYFSINHLFYKRKEQPLNTFGPTNLNETKKFLFETASILSIPQIKIGEQIKPKSFSITASFDALYGTATYGGWIYGTNPLNISSDKYGNLIDAAFNTASIVSKLKFYEGFNEYFDTSRITYKSENVSYVAGVTSTTGLQKPYGKAAQFSGSGYIQTEIDGLYNRNNDYAISLFVSASNSTSNNEIILTKASSSLSSKYPFKLELDPSNQVIFSAAGATDLKVQTTSSADVTQWTHVVCQKSQNVLEMYINGTLHSSASAQILQIPANHLTASARIDNNEPLHIGGFETSSFLHGKLDEIRIFNKALTATEIGYLGDRTQAGTLLQTNHIGNIFNKQGIAVISTPDYRFDNLLELPYTASYRSTKTIHELNVIAKLDAGDFNMSINNTLTNDDDTTYQNFVSGSSFAPYITSIGLYNDAGQLLAIAKLAQAIRKRPDVDMNFVVQLDLDKNIILNE